MTTGPVARAQARARRFRRVRGVAAGSVAAFGALVAHVVAGGSLELVPGLVVTAVVVPMSIALTPGNAVGLARIAGTALVAQTLGHLCLMLAPSGAPAHAHGHAEGAAAAGPVLPTLTMLGLHALVAVATIVIAAGLDRAALDVVRAAAGWLLPLLLAVALPVVGYRTRTTSRVRRLRGRPAARPGRPRAPPWGSAPLVPSCAMR
ncbi:hypothetical protein KVF89_17680 [Nocardioides carbamazepini]|uniref:hypothetical protein n=1 Tax=Nocardioides carbamazepini TaxID=2854259 RepID=UPI00214A7D76|nr:hypothetical protein [Nocardioides carbamazepini]MCR1784377.1 hypothetical protein [Nocardioides carbamazepini]